MNLTNNNPVGCRQVAMCGGLDTIASLLVAHFPNPQSSPPLVSPGKQKKQRPGGPQHGPSEVLKEKGGQADQDLDMVVVALGVLCNLVEKDEGNRCAANSSTFQLRSGVFIDLIVSVQVGAC